MSGGMPAHSGKVDVEQNDAISLKKNNNELTIAKIYANKADYAEKKQKSGELLLR